MAEVAETAELLKKFGPIKQTKTYVKVTKDKKTACIQKDSIFLMIHRPDFGQNVRIFSDDEIKKRHLGKFKYLMKAKDSTEMMGILDKYFA